MPDEPNQAPIKCSHKVEAGYVEKHKKVVMHHGKKFVYISCPHCNLILFNCIGDAA